MTDWKMIVRNVAPALGAALGGPMAGMATKYIADTVLNDPTADSDAVAAYISGAGPDQLVALKQADGDFKIKLKELDIDLERIHQADRASARTLAVNNMVPHIVLSAVFIGGYFFCLQWIITELIDAAVPDNVLMLLSTLLGLFTREIPTIMQFWFGSSIGSKDKTAALTRPPP